MQDKYSDISDSSSINYEKLFSLIHPDFFNQTYIRNMPQDYLFSELVLDLRKPMPSEMTTSLLCPSEIYFDEYHGEIKKIQEAVSLVDNDWVQYFNDNTRIFCAFDKKSNDKIAAFCILSNWGIYNGIRIGGPGCVGTIPEYRKKGIGLELVRKATELFIKDGYDISWIHYTHLEKWYSKLGYKTVLKWNANGFCIAE